MQIRSFLFDKVFKNKKSRITSGLFYSQTDNYPLSIVYYQLFNKFNLLRFLSIYTIKETLLVHPFVAVHFAHVS